VYRRTWLDSFVVRFTRMRIGLVLGAMATRVRRARSNARYLKAVVPAFGNGEARRTHMRVPVGLWCRSECIARRANEWKANQRQGWSRMGLFRSSYG